MWDRKNKTWVLYPNKNILATTKPDALFLMAYLRYTGISRGYVLQLEVVELQQYKVIRNPRKVYAAIREQHKTPFVFFVGRN